MPQQLLVIEDEPNLRELIADVLSEDGYAVSAVGSIQEAETWLSTRAPDVLLLDVKLPDGDGLELLARLRKSGLLVPAVVITAFGTVERAVQAMRSGASDFVVKPFDTGRLRAAVASAEASGRRLDEALLEAPVVEDPPSDPTARLVGGQGGLEQVLALLPRVAATDATVLVLGESGTGKELVARALHDTSARRDGPFLGINCASLPPTLIESELFGFERGAFTGAHAAKKGLFETAEGGSIFLDEIGDMPLEAQGKLLRVLQEREVVRVGGRAPVGIDVRVIAATHRDLRARVEQGAFRQDLLFRLEVVPIRLPPLRARRGDIPGLIEHFTDRHLTRHGGKRPRLDPETRRAVMAHAWPGNVRELENWVERAVVLGHFDTAGWAAAETAEPEHAERAPAAGAPAERVGADRGPVNLAPAEPAAGAAPDAPDVVPLRAAVAAAERSAVIAALRSCGGNKAEAARRLGVSYKTLFNKIHEHDIKEARRIE